MVAAGVLPNGSRTGDVYVYGNLQLNTAGYHGIINGLFGTPNREEPFLSFAKAHAALIDEEIGRLAAEYPEMRIPITDALRVQFLCDSREGCDSEAVLARARDLGILILDREVPLPDHFMTLARRLGEAHHVTCQVRIHSH